MNLSKIPSHSARKARQAANRKRNGSFRSVWLDHGTAFARADRVVSPLIKWLCAFKQRAKKTA